MAFENKRFVLIYQTTTIIIIMTEEEEEKKNNNTTPFTELKFGQREDLSCSSERGAFSIRITNGV